MGPEERRHWVRMVLRCPDLTPAAKTVLIALETFANFRDGTNAHPGEEKLAAMTGGLTIRAVQSAMNKARALKLIDRTAPANPKAGKAAVWRLTFPPGDDSSTRMDVPVEHDSTRTHMPVETPSTRTHVPVETANTGTSVRQYRNAHDVSTRTYVPPTTHTPPKYQGIADISGGRVTSVGAQAPRPQCHLHEENCDGPCRYCQRRREWETANAGWRERDELERRRQLREIADNCPRCHGTGTYTAGENLAAKCDPHLTPEAIAHV